MERRMGMGTEMETETEDILGRIVRVEQRLLGSGPPKLLGLFCIDVLHGTSHTLKGRTSSPFARKYT